MGNHGFLAKHKYEDLKQREVIPYKTEIILTTRFTVYTVHLMRDDGMTICNQYANGECMRKDSYTDPIYEFKNCKRCFKTKGDKGN